MQIARRPRGVPIRHLCQPAKLRIDGAIRYIPYGQAPQKSAWHRRNSCYAAANSSRVKMKVCASVLALAAIALPVYAADCTPAINSKGLITPRGTVEMTANVSPMTVGQKGELWLHPTYSPINLAAAAGSA